MSSLYWYSNVSCLFCSKLLYLPLHIILLGHRVLLLVLDAEQTLAELVVAVLAVLEVKRQHRQLVRADPVPDDHAVLRDLVLDLQEEPHVHDVPDLPYNRTSIALIASPSSDCMSFSFSFYCS